MTNANDEIKLVFINKQYPGKPILFKIKKPVVIYDLKSRLVSFFDKKIRPYVTDFRLVKQGPPEDDKNDTLELNYFDEKYNEADAYDCMKEVKKSTNYTYKTLKEPAIYFRTIMKTINITIIESAKESIETYPLRFKYNSYDDLILNMPEKLFLKPYHVFHNNKDLDDISTETDLKYYLKHGLIFYFYPINAQFLYNSTNQKTNILLKFDKPLDYYYDEIFQKLRINSKRKNLSFRIKDNNTWKEIDRKVGIHQILKKQSEEPVSIVIFDLTPHIVYISVPFENDQIVFNFEFYDTIKISDLIKQIKEYFGLNDQEISLKQIDGKNAPKTKSIKEYTSKNETLILNYDQSEKLVMNRSFKINKEIVNKEIHPNEKVIKMMKKIANEYDSNKLLVKLKLDKIELDSRLKFANYFIPPDQVISVEIAEFSNHIPLIFYGFEKDSSIEISAGFIPDMKIKSLRNLSKFKEIVPKNHQKTIYFFLFSDNSYQILDDSKSFKYYNLKGNEKIKVYAKYNIFIYQNIIYPIYNINLYDDVINDLQDFFKLSPNIQFSIFNSEGKKVQKQPQNSNFPKYPSGSKLEIKVPSKMKFNVTFLDKKYQIEADSTKQVKFVKDELSKQCSIPSEKIQLFNDLGVNISQDSYLCLEFKENEEEHVYEIQAQKAKSFTFQLHNGKFYNETFLPSMKIGEALKQLKNHKKSIEGESFIIYMGRVVDNNSTFSSLIGSKKDENNNNNDDDDDLTELLMIEEKMPPQILITLNFQFDQIPESADGGFKFVKNTEVRNVRYLASQISKQDYDSIILIANDEMLNDETILENDTKITVDLSKSLSGNNNNKDTMQEILSMATTRILKEEEEETDKKDDINTTQRIVQKPKAVKSSSSDDDSDLEYFDEEDENDDDPLAKGNGTYEIAENGPDDEYVFKFKIINGEKFNLQLKKDVNVKEIIEKIAEREETDEENITIFVGNQRLADFNKPTNLIIPKQVSYFSVKIIDLQNTLVCSRVKLRK